MCSTYKLDSLHLFPLQYIRKPETSLSLSLSAFMDNHKELFFFFFLFFALLTGAELVQGSSHHRHDHHRGGSLSKLFVFGDSYADTGNLKKSLSSSWKEPYGITFPGRPSGRFSNGRVFTDYVASFLGIKSPIPYKWRKIGPKLIRYGMNFAYGGTGVFDTLVPAPNMTAQIQLFKQLLADGVYSKCDLNSSVALLSVAGNDYGAYNARNGTAEGQPAFIASVVNQIGINLKQIHDLGVKKIAVAGLGPLGCLPSTTVISSYQQCNGTQNLGANFHNQLLQQVVQKLNNETANGSSPFVIVDLFTAFMSVLKIQRDHPGSTKFENPLKPCCMGISAKYSCGSVNEIGEKKYTVCDDPGNAFFWDSVHPSQQGWRAVYSTLKASLDQLYV